MTAPKADDASDQADREPDGAVWFLPTSIIRDLAATITALEAQVAIAELEDLLATADERAQEAAERSA